MLLDQRAIDLITQILSVIALDESGSAKPYSQNRANLKIFMKAVIEKYKNKEVPNDLINCFLEAAEHFHSNPGYDKAANELHRIISKKRIPVFNESDDCYRFMLAVVKLYDPSIPATRVEFDNLIAGLIPSGRRYDDKIVLNYFHGILPNECVGMRFPTKKMRDLFLKAVPDAFESVRADSFVLYILTFTQQNNVLSERSGVAIASLLGGRCTAAGNYEFGDKLKPFTIIRALSAADLPDQSPLKKALTKYEALSAEEKVEARKPPAPLIAVSPEVDPDEEKAQAEAIQAIIQQLIVQRKEVEDRFKRMSDMVAAMQKESHSRTMSPVVLDYLNKAKALAAANLFIDANEALDATEKISTAPSSLPVVPVRSPQLQLPPVASFARKPSSPPVQQQPAPGLHQQGIGKFAPPSAPIAPIDPARNVALYKARTTDGKPLLGIKFQTKEQKEQMIKDVWRDQQTLPIIVQSAQGRDDLLFIRAEIILNRASKKHELMIQFNVSDPLQLQRFYENLGLNTNQHSVEPHLTLHALYFYGDNIMVEGNRLTSVLSESFMAQVPKPWSLWRALGFGE